ncbi:MAG: NAD(P)H-dependent oxidoreductase [Candidatus Tenebribacter mawsonii]|nr:NAD(P)H-dependent oxidoreductase [Candidatus Tenebribacter mawsonii]
MKVLAFAASSSSRSINKKLVTYALSFLKGVEIELLDLNNYELPLFSEDIEKEIGQPALAKEFLRKIGESDALLISFAEHNGSYSVAYKNIFDWCSRIKPKVFQGKLMVLLSTSPGKRGGSSVLVTAESTAHRFAGKVKASLSIPSFEDNFDLESNTLINIELKEQLERVVTSLLKP